MNDPLNLAICADAVAGTVDPLDDQVWEIAPGSGEPLAFAIRSQLGMRAAEARYFPVFMRGNEMVIDPRDFHSPPVIKRMLANYLEIIFSPLEGVDVVLEYWIPGSRILAGRIAILNRDPGVGKLEVDWVGQLTPVGEGAAMMPETVDLNTVLTGGCGGAEMVCFISGGCGMGSSVYPGLSLQINPRSAKTQFFTWASAAYDEKSASYHAARNNAFRGWEAEISRVESVNESRWVEIYTAREDWDAVLHASQKTGFSLVFPIENSLPGFLRKRTPQDGCEGRGSNRFLGNTRSGQTAWDSLHLAGLLLPGGVDLVRGFLENLLKRQQKDGRLAWSCGTGAGSGKLNAQPVAAQIALALEPYLDDTDWLVAILPSLERFFLSWFLPSADRDYDGFPEWRANGQSGWAEEDLPWIGELESPGLAATLLKEAEAIRMLNARIGRSDLAEMEAITTRLTGALLQSWDKSEGLFRYRDHETHQTSGSEILVEADKDGNYPLKRKFTDPVRLVLKMDCGSGLRKHLQIILRGNYRGEPYTTELKSRDFTWRPGGAVAVARGIFSRLDRMIIRGLAEGDTLRLETCDSGRQDFSLVLPVVANEVPPEISEIILRETLKGKFLFEKGLRAFPGSNQPAPILFCAYLAEGLLAKGERNLAAGIFGSLLDDYAGRLTDRMLPAANSLENTVPVSTFLKICGVEAITPREVILNGFNPFPGLVEVRYRNVRILLQANKSVVLLNMEEPKVITSPERIRISLGHSSRRS